MLIKTIDIRCLKRLISALYHIVSEVFRSIFFSKSDNSAECHIKADFRKHCEIKFFILSKVRCIVMSFNLFMKVYISR